MRYTAYAFTPHPHPSFHNHVPPTTPTLHITSLICPHYPYLLILYTLLCASTPQQPIPHSSSLYLKKENNNNNSTLYAAIFQLHANYPLLIGLSITQTLPIVSYPLSHTFIVTKFCVCVCVYTVVELNDSRISNLSWLLSKSLG